MLSGSSGKAMRNLMAVFAEYQSDVTGEHTRSVKANLKKNHKVYCPYPPIGFKNEDGVLSPDPQGMAVVNDVIEMHRQGVPLYRIAKTLNDKGIKGSKGGIFYASTIQKIINNKIYASN
jgi:DNA invertase Pin-like site-specific DNA recombinase